jgi:hypothetical protein
MAECKCGSRLNLNESFLNFFRASWGVLDACMDRRLVKTFLALIMAILMHRHRNHGLLLSELGCYLKQPQLAPAGTKRISWLLQSPK